MSSNLMASKSSIVFSVNLPILQSFLLPPPVYLQNLQPLPLKNSKTSIVFSVSCFLLMRYCHSTISTKLGDLETIYLMPFSASISILSTSIKAKSSLISSGRALSMGIKSTTENRGFLFSFACCSKASSLTISDPPVFVGLSRCVPTPSWSEAPF